jgi:PAS domain S-box-containing protein
MSIEFSTTITPGFEALVFKASRGIEDIYELTKVRKDGSLFPAVVSVTALRDAQNAIIGYLLIGTDNTARKEAEALRRDRETAESAFLGSEERFATLIRSIMDGIISVDVKQNIVLFNPAARRMFGYPGAELLGLPIAKLMPGLPGGKDREELLELSEDEGVFRGGEAIGKRADGMEFPIETSVSRTLIGGEKIITIIVRDITERKKAEAALLERESLLRIAGNIAHFGGMIVVFPEQKITCSEEIFSILDLAPGTLLTLEEILNFPALEWREMTRQAYADCIRDGIPFDIEIEIVTGMGYRKWVRAIGHPRRGVAGSVVEINGAFQDISDRKKMEQQFLRAQRMESVGTLASGIAHDLNNILTPVMMAVDLLRMNITGRDDLELLDTIAVNTKRGAEMVNQVLSFGRGVEGRRVVVQVRDLVKEIEKIARDSFPKDIEMRTVVPADLWTIVGDPTQLHQVLLNLGVNARDAMPRGGILTITAENIVLDAHYVAADLDATEGPYVIMRIEDTGIGIPREIIEKIFDPFFTTKAIGQGTGLGLSTSLSIVKSHGGFMHVYSEPGKGTQFQVYLPAGTKQLDQAPGEKVALIRGNGETILVVDDEPSIRKMARRILETFGYQVIEAADGVQALGLYSDHRNTVAVVIMDMMMPKMGGLATIQALIKENPDVRIIAASGIPASGAEAGAAAPGAVKQFLHKPYTTELLLTAVHQALGADS